MISKANNKIVDKTVHTRSHMNASAFHMSTFLGIQKTKHNADFRVPEKPKCFKTRFWRDEDTSTSEIYILLNK